MYLKSLTLRGFKSFADKVSLALEPGITAIVGPNGSGKSNISDAVLWVLGERNAKNLRGQAMEDVIFAGSSARKATSFAEVELVLDNSDHVLPMDFEEISVARRMYRTGESEYLINGTVARRMDVLDILHDTGLGVGTHSIISQGSIDSVLKSKPEDRRALIEEAAGVLKHKQRLARSARKLERMDNHVERIRDIVGEVSRQLGPLERRAKRAKRYEELSAELAGSKLILSTDNLRVLQQKHGVATENTHELERKLEDARSKIEEVEEKTLELQKKLREDSEDAGILSRRQRRVSSVLDSVRSRIALIRDRKRSATDRATEAELAIQELNSAIEGANAGYSRAKLGLESSCKAEQEATARADSLLSQYSELESKSKELEAKIAELRVSLEDMERSSFKANQEKSILQESLTSGLAHMKVLDEHAAELKSQTARTAADVKNAESEAEQLEAALKIAEEQEKSSRGLVATCSHARDAARKALEEASSSEASIRAQIDALDAIEKRRAENAGDARLWVERGKLGVNSEPISKAVKAEGGFESIVEFLLGSDMDALIVEDESVLSRVASALSAEGIQGEVTLISKGTAYPNEATTDLAAQEAASKPGRELLIDHLKFDEAYAGVIEALLGDVVVCQDRQDALGAHEEHRGVRFVVSDGTLVWPSGKVTIGATVLEEDQGVLARLRHLDELRSGLESATKILENAKSESQNAERALSDAQTESLKLSEKLAELKGSAQSARAQALAFAEKLESANKELEDAISKRDIAAENVAQARPDIEEHDRHIKELSANIERAKGDIKEMTLKVAPIKDKTRLVSEELQEARVAAAKAQEKRAYDELMVERHLQDIKSYHRDLESKKKLLKVKKVSSIRLDELIASYEKLEGSVQRSAIALEDESNLAASSTSGLYAESEALRLRSNELHASFDEINQRLADARVELARIELQVENAVTEIVDVCNTPLEVALAMPKLEDRPEVEETVETLERRISNLGTINPDAAREYDELKERYDYLDAQLRDLHEASRALRRIDRMIEGRMKEDFITTFEEIDKNFQEIFALLFPGGSAYLTLEDTDDVENAGVEVHAQPAGKRIAKMSLMSGGEKSLTALALLFALYRTRPTPFYILDEVEAALDDTNLRRLTSFINAMRTYTQLIMITHQRRTMEMADVLFGVSMQSDGVTKVVSQKLERALEQAE